ncbi:hypothetical protein [Planctomicrobium piriforme]|uniref:Carboxypeptidase regulatory-like domain-containing protein n=1 Tax=Planctomicrobium piriforme TaxID=1576369 RepID=A0A1I3H291_9PLAN|nr:hypothetical protein [Planctomicrobium piriforme]SFI29844.1 hypothetical protein SAMN05421753_107223 [Planctomicrobium piriforme]
MKYVKYLVVLMAALAVTSGVRWYRSTWDPYPRLPLTGTVTLDGVPMADGYVFFEPKENQPTHSGGLVRGGKFDVPRAEGVVPGLYSVAIIAASDLMAPPNSPGTVMSPISPTTAIETSTVSTADAERVVIPLRYNKETVLRAQVKAGLPNHFQFELLSDSEPGLRN